MTSVALNRQDEDFIRKQLDSGYYNDAGEVVREALRMMKEFEDERDRWLREEMPVRYAALQRDPTKGTPFEIVREQFESRRAGRSADVE